MLRWLRRRRERAVDRPVPVAEPLEPRLLYSADIAAGLALAASVDTGATEVRTLAADGEYGSAVASTQASVQAAYARLGLQFEQNAGQADPAIDYVARGSGYGIALEGGNATLTLVTAQGERSITLALQGAHAAGGAGEDLLAARSNYIVGSDASQWHTDIANYGAVRYGSVYDGIDLRYYGTQQQLEYDFIVAPGADAGAIRLAFEGSSGAAVDAAGNLVLQVAGSDSTVRFKAPVAYQHGDDGQLQAVASRYALHADGSIGFTLGAYDPGRELVIDPVLDYATYFGESGAETALAVATDAAGNVYITGRTTSNSGGDWTNNVVNSGGGGGDIFVAKFNATLSALAWSTRIGGSGDEQGNAIDVDANGNVAVTGWTRSNNFPTQNADQGSSGGGQDAVIFKLNASGGLVFSTYFGGTAPSDSGNAVAFDAAGNLYAAGKASDNGLLPLVLQLVFGASDNAFVNKYGSTGALAWSQLLGGSDTDGANGIAVGASGDVYVVGDTQSANFSMTGGEQTSRSGPGDGFLARLNSAGAIQYSTYLGGTDNDTATAVAVDPAGKAYVVGMVRVRASVVFTTTSGAFQASAPANNKDTGYLRVYDTTKTGAASLTYSSFLGGTNNNDVPTGVAYANGRVIVVGDATSNDFPVTADAAQATNAGNSLYLAVLNPAGGGSADLQYATYYGKTLNAGGVAVSSNHIYFTGDTGAGGYATAGSYQSAKSGGSDALVVALSLPNSAPVLSGVVQPPAILEDSGAGSGFLVSALLAGKVTDSDAGALQGIAITAAAGSSGSWQYSVDNGGSWTTIGAVSAGNALLLAADGQTRLRFVPAADFAGTANLTVRAWDQSSGAAGGRASVAANGASTAFSSATATVAQVVTAVNDPPVRIAGNVNNLVVAEDSGVTGLGLGGLLYGTGGGSDESGQVGTWRVVTVPPATLGTIVLADGSTAVTANTVYTLAQLRGMQFRTAADAFGGPSTFSWTVSDDGGGTDTLSESLTITVTPVNDAPVARDDTLAATEDTAVTFTAAQLLGNDSDVEGNALSIYDVVAVAGGSVVLNGNGTVTFTPNADFAGAASFRYRASDGSARSAPATVTVNVANTPDAPRPLADTLAATEDSSITYSASALLGNDSDPDGDPLTIASVTSGSGGTAVLNGDGTVTFTPDADFSGAASFSYTASDGSLASAAAGVTVNVAPVNDAPVRTAGTLAKLVVVEGSGLTPLGLGSVAYGPGGGAGEAGQVLTYTVTALPTGAGTIVLADGTTAVVAGNSYTLAQLQGMQLRTGGSASASGTFAFTVKDNGGTAAGGADSLAQSLGVTVLNQAPALNGLNALEQLEDAATHPGVRVADLVAGQIVDPLDARGVAITGTGDPHGAWEYSTDGGAHWTAIAGVSEGHALLLGADAATRVRFLPVADFHGTAGGLDLRAWDRTSGSAGGFADASINGGSTAFSAQVRTARVTVDPVNDAPVRTAGSVADFTVAEGATQALGFAGLAYGPGGGGYESGQQLAYTVAAVPAPGFGRIELADGALVTAGSSYSLADLQGMRFVAAPGVTSGSATFAFRVQDDGGVQDGGSDTLAQGLTITVRNQAPVLAGANDLPAVAEDAGGNAGMRVADLVAGQITDPSASYGIAVVAASHANGVWQYSRDDGASWQDFGGVSAAQATLLAADGQNRVRFVAAADWNGSAGGLVFRAWDASGGTAGLLVGDASATGGSTPYSAQTAEAGITISAVNDAPVRTAGTVAGLSLAEDSPATSLGLAGLAYGPGGGADEAAQVLSFTVTALPPATLGRITLADGTSVGAGAYTLAQLQGMRFVAAADAVGTGSFRFEVRDGAGGSDTLAESLQLTVTPVNDAPSTSNVTLAPLAEDGGARTITAAQLLANANDVDGDALVVSAVFASSGVLVDNGDGTWSFTPAADDDTAVTFGYTISDGQASVSGSASLDLVPVNDAPTTAPVTLAALAEDGTRTITSAQLLANAADIDGGTLTVGNLVAGSGLLVDNGDGTWSFTPDADDDGGVTFTYTISDGSASVAGSASLDLLPVNDAPLTSIVTLAPLAEDGSRLLTSAQLLANASDIDSAVLTVGSLAASSGSLVDHHDGTWTFTPGANDDTGVTFTYTISDGVATAAGSASLDLTPVNDPPVTSPVTLAASAEDSPRTITAAELLAGASDIDGGRLTVGSLAAASGSVVDHHDGTWTFTPAADDDGAVSFTYTVSDGVASVAGSASLDLLPVNDAPVTSAVTLAASAEDGMRTITAAELLVNARDIDGDTLTVTGLVASSGSLVDRHDGTWTFTPAMDDDTAVSFSYTISDGAIDVAGSALLDLTPGNDAPSTSPVVLAALAEDSSRTITAAELLAQANDVDGDTLAVVDVVASSGSLVDHHDGTWTFTPGADDAGDVRFTYTVSDGVASVTGSASLDLMPVNDAPTTTAVILAASAEDSVRTITAAELLANARDVDGDTLTVGNLAAGSGTVVDHGDGTWSFTPAADDDGSVSFTYTVGDGVASVAGSARLDLTPVNDAPTTSAVTLAPLAEDGSRTITAAQLLANAADIDSGTLTVGNLLASSGTLVDHGDGTWSFTPAADDDTDVRFTYTISDGAASVAGSASLDLTPVNDAPATSEVTLVPSAEDGSRTITAAELLANARDVDSAGLTVANLAASRGMLVDHGNGTWTFTPVANDDGAVRFSYTVGDGIASVAGSATLDLLPVNDAPTALPVALAPLAEDGTRVITAAQLLAGATDIDGDALAVANLAASSGTLVDNGNGTWTFTPAADDDTAVGFTYTISDGVASVAGSASLDLVSVDDAPTSTPVTLPAMAEDGGSVTITAAQLLANAGDVDSTTLTVGNVRAGSGALVDNGDGTWTFTPARDDDTAVSFSYTISDGSSVVAASASMDLTPVDDRPAARDDVLGATQDTPITYAAASLLANDGDVEAEPLAIFSVHSGAGGTAALNADGSVTFTPDAGFTGAATFTYTIGDPQAQSLPATVTVNVVRPDTPPVIRGASRQPVVLQVAERETAVTTVQASDPDVPVQALGFSISGGADADRFTIDAATGALYFTAAPDYESPADVGRDNVYEVIVQVSDGVLSTRQAFQVAVQDVAEDAPAPPVAPAPAPAATAPAAALTVDVASAPAAAPAAAAPAATLAAAAPVAQPAAAPAPQTAAPAAANPARSAGGGELVATAGAAPGGDVPGAPAASTVLGAGAEPGRAPALRAVVIDRQGIELISLQAPDLGINGFTISGSAQAHTLEQLQRTLRSAGFAEGLDRLREDARASLALEQSITISVAGVSLGLSLVYVLWLIRGGVLMGSYLSALPAWRILDPLPVLARAGEQGEGDDEDEDLAARQDRGRNALRGFE